MMGFSDWKSGLSPISSDKDFCIILSISSSLSKSLFWCEDEDFSLVSVVSVISMWKRKKESLNYIIKEWFYVRAIKVFFFCYHKILLSLDFVKHHFEKIFKNFREHWCRFYMGCLYELFIWVVDLYELNTETITNKLK